MNHTPTPWEVGMSRNGLPSVDASTESPCTLEICMVWGTEKDMIVNDECEANAAFIVRACNAHDVLVELAEKVIGHFAGTGAPLEDFSRMALRLARGE